MGDEELPGTTNGAEPGQTTIGDADHIYVGAIGGLALALSCKDDHHAFGENPDNADGDELRNHVGKVLSMSEHVVGVLSLGIPQSRTQIQRFYVPHSVVRLEMEDNYSYN